MSIERDYGVVGFCDIVSKNLLTEQFSTDRCYIVLEYDMQTILLNNSTN